MSDYDNPGLPDDGNGNPGQVSTSAPAPVEADRAPATLDEIYKTHKIEDDAQRYKQEEFKPLAPVIREDGREILNALNGVTQEVNNLRQERHVTSVRSDINDAVAIVEKETGLDPKMIEVYLDMQARDDPRFQKVWMERKSNPNVFNAALKAVSNEIADRFQARPDPNLLANQKAMRAYASGSSTRQSASDGWENLSQSNFDQKWNALIS